MRPTINTFPLDSSYNPPPRVPSFLVFIKTCHCKFAITSSISTSTQSITAPLPSPPSVSLNPPWQPSIADATPPITQATSLTSLCTQAHHDLSLQINCIWLHPFQSPPYLQSQNKPVIISPPPWSPLRPTPSLSPIITAVDPHHLDFIAGNLQLLKPPLPSSAIR